MRMPDRRTIINCSQSIKDHCCPGIYYLIENHEVVYIGQSINMFARIGSHAVQGEKEFDSFYTVPMDVDDLYEAEWKEIIRLRPSLNATLPDNPVYANVIRLRTMLGMPVREINIFIAENYIIGEMICNQTFYKIADFGELKGTS